MSETNFDVSDKTFIANDWMPVSKDRLLDPRNIVRKDRRVNTPRSTVNITSNGPIMVSTVLQEANDNIMQRVHKNMSEHDAIRREFQNTVNNMILCLAADVFKCDLITADCYNAYHKMVVESQKIDVDINGYADMYSFMDLPRDGMIDALTNGSCKNGVDINIRLMTADLSKHYSTINTVLRRLLSHRKYINEHYAKEGWFGEHHPMVELVHTLHDILLHVQFMYGEIIDERGVGKSIDRYKDKQFRHNLNKFNRYLRCFIRDIAFTNNIVCAYLAIVHGVKLDGREIRHLVCEDHDVDRYRRLIADYIMDDRLHGYMYNSSFRTDMEFMNDALTSGDLFMGYSASFTDFEHRLRERAKLNAIKKTMIRYGAFNNWNTVYDMRLVRMMFELDSLVRSTDATKKFSERLDTIERKHPKMVCLYYDCINDMKTLYETMTNLPVMFYTWLSERYIIAYKVMHARVESVRDDCSIIRIIQDANRTDNRLLKQIEQDVVRK
jgi:hypothetical protein